MATSKNKGKVAGATGVEDGGTEAAKVRKRTSPEDVLAWGEDRDTAVIEAVLANPGRLTNTQLAKVLADHPAFADDARLLAPEMGGPEKLRQRVKKLSEQSVEMGLGPLKLKNRSNAGYDSREVIAATFARLRGGQTGMQTGQAAGLAVQPQQPLQAQSQPQPQQFSAGGLIPTAT